MGIITLSFWDFLLGTVTFISLGLVIFQNNKINIIRYNANAIYCQLWDIIDEIDHQRVSEVGQIKQLVNQV